MDFDTGFFKHFLLYGPFIDGAKITLALAVISQVAGILLGLVAALGRLSRLKLPIFRWPATVYLWLFRGTPLLVQIFFVYFAVPDITQHRVIISEFWSAFIALSLNEGAYMAEIIRAGITSVETGQMEAAESVGMTRGMAMRRIIIPQAIRIIIPPTGNEFISMLKNTSLAAVINTHELVFEQGQLSSATFRYFEPLTIICVWYLGMTTIATFFQGHLERYFARGYLREVRQPGLMQREMVRAGLRRLRPIPLHRLLDSAISIYGRNLHLLLSATALISAALACTAGFLIWVGLPELAALAIAFFTLLAVAFSLQAVSARYLGWSISMTAAYVQSGSETFLSLLSATLLAIIVSALGLIVVLNAALYRLGLLLLAGASTGRNDAGLASRALGPIPIKVAAGGALVVALYASGLYALSTMGAIPGGSAWTLAGLTLVGASALYLVVRFIFVPHVVVLENCSARRALFRSGDIATGAWWRVFSVVLALALAIGLLCLLTFNFVPGNVALKFRPTLVPSFRLNLVAMPILAALAVPAWSLVVNGQLLERAWWRVPLILLAAGGGLSLVALLLERLSPSALPITAAVPLAFELPLSAAWLPAILVVPSLVLILRHRHWHLRASLPAAVLWILAAAVLSLVTLLLEAIVPPGAPHVLHLHVGLFGQVRLNLAYIVFAIVTLAVLLVLRVGPLRDRTWQSRINTSLLSGAGCALLTLFFEAALREHTLSAGFRPAVNLAVNLRLVTLFFVLPTIVLPFVVTVLTLMYYDLRVRKEGPMLGQDTTALEAVRAA